MSNKQMNKSNATYEEPQCNVVETDLKQVIAASGIEPTSNPWENNTEEVW